VQPLQRRTKVALVILIAAIAISLNFLVLLQAMPETQRIDSGCCAPDTSLLAKDFSAFYFAAWNLFHDPGAIYLSGNSENATFLGIVPHPETFKYLPSFLPLAAPFLLLGYREAFDAFDGFQFALLVLIAFMVYEILERKNIAIIGAVLVVALVLPFSTIASWSFSEAYFWQWAEGQSKVLQLALLMASLFFGAKKKPVLSGIFLALGFFDPVVAVFALPLFVTLNRARILRAAMTAAASLVALNVPLLFLPGIASGFFKMLAAGGALTPAYYYAYIPILALVALSAAMWKEMGRALGLVKVELFDSEAAEVSR
jgi:Glycosyltransferase family 87